MAWRRYALHRVPSSLFVSSVCIVKCSVYLEYRLIFITVYMSRT